MPRLCALGTLWKSGVAFRPVSMERKVAYVAQILERGEPLVERLGVDIGAGAAIEEFAFQFVRAQRQARMPARKANVTAVKRATVIHFDDDAIGERKSGLDRADAGVRLDLHLAHQRLHVRTRDVVVVELLCANLSRGQRRGYG